MVETVVGKFEDFIRFVEKKSLLYCDFNTTIHLSMAPASLPQMQTNVISEYLLALRTTFM